MTTPLRICTTTSSYEATPPAGPSTRRRTMPPPISKRSSGGPPRNIAGPCHPGPVDNDLGPAFGFATHDPVTSFIDWQRRHLD